MLTAPERSRVDAAGIGLYETLHRDSIDEVTRDVRAPRGRRDPGVGQVLPDWTGAARVVTTRVASIVRDFPRVTAVALLTDADRHVAGRAAVAGP